MRKTEILSLKWEHVDVKQSFKKALKKAGIKDFVFYDLRHTFDSYLVMAGADLLMVKELLGQKTLTMMLRYAHLAPSQCNVLKR